MSRRGTTSSADSIAEAIYRSYESEEAMVESWKRRHLGASVLGHKCDRYLWLLFRWARNPRHDGRKLRLFDRGRIEEIKVRKELVGLGWKVVLPTDEYAPRRAPWAENSHVSGEVDFLFARRDDGPIREAIVECKTANAKSFARIVRMGMRAAKPEHYVQCQVYMAIYRQQWCLYIVTNKDTEEIHAEWIAYDEEFAQKAIERGRAIVAMNQPPEKIAAHEYPPCRWTSVEGEVFLCDFYKVCHGQEIPERNCRTCTHSTPSGLGLWTCDVDSAGLGGVAQAINMHRQRLGCDKHRFVPPIINAQVTKVGFDPLDGEFVEYQTADGEQLRDRGPTRDLARGPA